MVDDFIEKIISDIVSSSEKEKKSQKPTLPIKEPEKPKEEPKETEYKKIGDKIVLFEDKIKRIYKTPTDPLPIYELKHATLKPEHEKILNEIYNEFVEDSKIMDFRNREQIKAYIKQKLKEKYPTISKGLEDVIIMKILAKVQGYGALQPFLEDDDLEEVMVIGVNKPVYVYHRKFHMCETNLVFTNEKDILNIIEKIAIETGRRIDQQNPLLDAHLKDGSRVNATIPPISLDGPTITIRKFRKDPLTIVDLIKFGSLSIDLAAFLWLAVDGLGAKPANILVAGGTGSGKTTLLNSLSLFIPPTERVITIEDTAELQLTVKHWVRLETRPPNIEGKGEITMDDLVKNTLRMRPDRIIVGEMRGPEARTFFTALNTGHDGGMGTIHANSARETITRLESPPMSVPQIMIPALDFIIMQNRFHNPRKGTVRRVTEVAEVTGIESGVVTLSKIFEYNAAKDKIEPTDVVPTFYTKLTKMTGLSMKDILYEREVRGLVLQYLVEKNYRSIKQVGEYITKFYVNKEELINQIMEEFEGSEHAETDVTLP